MVTHGFPRGDEATEAVGTAVFPPAFPSQPLHLTVCLLTQTDGHYNSPWFAWVCFAGPMCISVLERGCWSRWEQATLQQLSLCSELEQKGPEAPPWCSVVCRSEQLKMLFGCWAALLGTRMLLILQP